MSERGEELDAKEPAVLVGAAAVLIGLGLAAWNAWTCDDAFISYRYARNLVEGHGLVFNVGERVEGYTNLLWTLWVAVGLLFGLGPDTWSIIWGLVAYAVVLVLLLAFHVDLRRRISVSRFTLPVACLVAALHPDFNVFATSGLETSAFTAAALGGYFLLVSGIVEGKPRPLVTGALFGIASMLRPDGVVFASVAGVALLVTEKRRWRNVALFALGVLVFWGGTTAFRLLYYGEYFPNTYYAKSAYLSWHRQGLIYLGKYLQKYWVLFVAPFTLAFGMWRARGALHSSAQAPDWFRTHAVVSTAFAGVYTYYVVRVGGDFMFARLLIPVTPYLAILLELALYRLSLVRGLVYTELSVLALGMPLVTPRPVSGTDWADGIADEHAVYNDDWVRQDEQKAKILSKFFEGLPVRVAFLGTEARLMYDADIPVAIESDTGLTDKTIAHQALTKRGRIGHEKRASALYLITVRKAHFMFAPLGPEAIGIGDYIPVMSVELGPVKAWIVHWDPGVMDKLRERGAVFTDFPSYLDQYIESLDRRSLSDVAKDYRKFRYFYFDQVSDPKRDAAFVSRLHSG